MDDPAPRNWTGATVIADGVNHYFGGGETRKQVLFDNRLELMRGEIVIMTGPSGSGKTTLLTLIGGLRSLQEGKLTVLGQDVAGLAPPQLVQVRRRIGFIFQAHNLFDALTAKENVRMALELFPGRTKRELDYRATEMLVRLGLKDRVNAKPQQLSGGQRQRVAIARALVNRPKLILADEPTAALDKDSGQEVVKLLKELARNDGCTILLVTHDNRILESADRIVNMSDGKIAVDIGVDESVALGETLAKVPAIANKDLGLISGIATKAKFQRRRRGSTITRYGQPAEDFYVIRSGRVRVIAPLSQDKTETYFLESGDFFGEEALVSDEPYAYTAIADDDVELYTLSRDSFRRTVASSRPFRERLLNSLFNHQDQPT